MLGSIIGDIAGSIYEFHNIKTKQFPLLAEECEITDDSILTIATAAWLLQGAKEDAGSYYLDFARKYPNPMGAYGTSFSVWVKQGTNKPAAPYNSCGNGSAMRVGPVGWSGQSEEEVMTLAKRSAACTHNHPEGVKGAQATALCIWLARNKATKKEIREAVEQRFHYDLHFTCNDIRDTYGWEGTCQHTVPQAIVAFLDGESFEDSIRNAISIGGDSDTLACITGSIAEAFYSISAKLRSDTWSYLPKELKSVVCDFEAKYGKG